MNVLHLYRRKFCDGHNILVFKCNHSGDDEEYNNNNNNSNNNKGNTYINLSLFDNLFHKSIIQIYPKINSNTEFTLKKEFSQNIANNQCKYSGVDDYLISLKSSVHFGYPGCMHV